VGFRVECLVVERDKDAGLAGLMTLNEGCRLGKLNIAHCAAERHCVHLFHYHPCHWYPVVLERLCEGSCLWLWGLGFRVEQSPLSLVSCCF